MTQKNYLEIKIILADDHETFRSGLMSIFEKEKHFIILDQVSNGFELIQSISQHLPDVILMDIQMPKMNGIDATKQIKKLYPHIGIIALSFKDDDDSIIEMIEAGANGYLIKSALKQEILEGIVTVFKGKNYYCKNTNSKFLDLLKTRNFDRHNISKKNTFTDKEIEIIQYLCKGLTAKEIANKSGTSKRTVENQKLKIQEKMNVHNVAGIIMYAVKHKLVEV